MTEDLAKRDVWAGPELWLGPALLISGLVLNYGVEHLSLSLALELILPIVAVWLAAAGMLLLLSPLWDKGASSSVNHRLLASTLTGLFLAVIFGVIFLTAEFSDKGVGSYPERAGLEQVVTSSVTVPQSISVPSRQAVFFQTAMFGVFLRRYDIVLIYGVTERAAQDRVLQNLTEYRRKHRTKPMRVEFYEKENWTPIAYDQQGKGVGGQRGPENLLRVATIR
jgi:hypothetical protein